jgi:hypothetical protein
MNPMSLARGAGVNPWQQAETVHGEAVEKEAVVNHRLRRDGYVFKLIV